MATALSGLAVAPLANEETNNKKRTINPGKSMINPKNGMFFIKHAVLFYVLARKLHYIKHEEEKSKGERDMLSNIGIPGLIIILVIALIVFGPTKLPEMGRAVGDTLKEFKKSTKELTSDDEKEDDKEDDKEKENK